MMRPLAALFIAPWVLACNTGSGAAAPRSPESVASTTEAGKAQRSGTDDEDLRDGPPADVLYAAPTAVPAPSTSCTDEGSLPSATKCDSARDDLASALILEGANRDAALAELEGCTEFPRGLIRALRAEMGPPACAD